ncbi:hypothetical protein D3C71_2083280 [compost metagenome]
MARRLDVVGKHRLPVTPGDEDIRADDLCGIAVADLQQLRRRYGQPSPDAGNGDDDRGPDRFQYACHRILPSDARERSSI